MAFSFYKTRRVRQFSHKPIYWDPRKEKLEKRILSIKNRMDNSSNNIDEDIVNNSSDWVEDDARQRISESLYSNASHIRRQRSMGIDRHSRTDKIIKLIIILLALCSVFWYFYY